MKLYLVRRWGQHSAGSTVTVDDEAQAAWLLDHNFAQRSKSATSVTDNAVAAGGHGPDPRAGGDGSRRRPADTPSSDDRENRAWPVAGSPVQYNAGVRSGAASSNSASSNAALVDHDGGDHGDGAAAAPGSRRSSRRKAAS